MPPGLDHMRDQIGPGRTTLTRTAGAYCLARAFVRYRRPALHVPYSMKPGSGCFARSEPVFTTAPPRVAICGINARHVRTVPIRFTSNDLAQISSDASSNGVELPTPRLLIRMSGARPNCFNAYAVAFSTPADVARSAATIPRHFA